MSQWKTHRGDEWSYSDFWCEAEASMGSAQPAQLAIETIKAKASQLTKERLHELLWLARQQFPEVQLQVSVAKPELLAMLEALAIQQKVSYHILENPYSREIRLLSVEEPARHVR